MLRKDALSALVCLALAVPCSAEAGSITYAAYVGVVGGDLGPGTGNLFGNGASGNGSNCTTAGPSSPQAFFPGTGVSTPEGGIGPCHYFGGEIYNTGNTPQSATGNVASTFNGSSYSGSAQASAGSPLPNSAQNPAGAFELYAAAQSTFTGNNGSVVFDEAGADATITDTAFLATCAISAMPGNCGANEHINPHFIWDMTLNAESNGFADGDWVIKLQMQMTPDNQGPRSALQVYFSGGTSKPTFNCYDLEACPAFTLGPGSLSGSNVSLNYVPFDEGITLNAQGTNSFTEEAGFQVYTSGHGSVDPGAALTGVTWTDGNGNPVTGITLTTSLGTYTDSGYTAFDSAAPEPGSWLLSAMGLFGIAGLGRLRARRSMASV